VKRVNKKVIEALIKSGAFDDLHPQSNRAAMFAAMEGAVEEAQKAERERLSGQTSLFGLLSAPAGAPSANAAAPPRKYPDVDDWVPKERLAFEKEALGFYISGHPLDRYAADLKRFGAISTPTVQEREDWDEVQVAGVVSAWKEWPLKSGDGRMAVFSLEDNAGTVKVACFNKAFQQFEAVLKTDEPLLVTGKVKPGRQLDESEDAPRAAKELNLSDVVPLSRLRAEKTRQMMLRVPAEGLTEERVDQLKSVLERHKGTVSTVLRVTLPTRSYADYVLPAEFSVTPTDELLARLERLFGAEVARLR
jgi:DNA polymerase-3 subunit alpha